MACLGWYLYVNNPQTPLTMTEKNNSKNTTYTIDDLPVSLVAGEASTPAAPGSASEIVTKYFGNEVATDLNNDGREDLVFLLTQSPGGSGTFFYVVAALNTSDGWVGSKGYLLGDRIAPQTTELSQDPNHQNVIVVNYLDRAAGQSRVDQPSVGKSVWLKLDPTTMAWGEVEQNFVGEADPSTMTLTTKPWTWIKTSYNNDTELVPKSTEDFTVTFKNDSTFSATTDCNSLSGSYVVSDNQLTFGETASTLMFCEGSEEQAFSSMLREVQSYMFTSKGELILGLKLDTGTSVFK